MLNIRGVVAPLAASEDATVRRYAERIEVRMAGGFVPTVTSWQRILLLPGW